MKITFTNVPEDRDIIIEVEKVIFMATGVLMFYRNKKWEHIYKDMEQKWIFNKRTFDGAFFDP